MPKIIENLEERLMEEAGRQIGVSGYAAVTIRSVAKACGVGVGTVYNYFPSKDALLAAFMLKDWKRCTDTICAVSEASQAPEPVVRCICGQLREFAQLYRSVFCDEAAAAGFAGAFGRYHKLLRSQLAAPLRKFCADDFTGEFIAEALLCWSMTETDLDMLCGTVSRLF